MAPAWGEVTAAELARVVVVSPHLDDAVLGAAHLLASHPDTHVITVMAGAPPRYPDPPTEWDSLGGFGPGDDILARRREEDRAALALLDTEATWLDFVDYQYLSPPERAPLASITAVLEATLDQLRPTAVVIPMGLANPDHVSTHDAIRPIIGRRPELAWFAYEDAGYIHIPGLLAWRISGLFHSGLWPTPAVMPVHVDHPRKRAAIDCYRSQLGPLQRDHGLARRLDAEVPEQYWRLAPPPEGWEALAALPNT